MDGVRIVVIYITCYWKISRAISRTTRSYMWLNINLDFFTPKESLQGHKEITSLTLYLSMHWSLLITRGLYI